MKQQWKVIVPLMLSGSLMACSTTSQIPVEPEQKPKVEQPKPETEQQTKPAEKPVEKPAIVLKAKKNVRWQVDSG